MPQLYANITHDGEQIFEKLNVNLGNGEGNFLVVNTNDNSIKLSKLTKRADNNQMHFEDGRVAHFFIPGVPINQSSTLTIRFHIEEWSNLEK